MTLPDRLEKHFTKTPDVTRAAFVAANATVIGDVTLGAQSSIWYGCVLRGDINSIVIGDGTNVQDGTIVHLADDYGVRVGQHTTIGHAAIIHACEIGNECLIGMGATILDGAVIGDRCIVGANALVTQRFVAPPGSMILGAPAKVVRPLTEAEQAKLRPWAEKYIVTAGVHAAAFRAAAARKTPGLSDQTPSA
ncbi:MAG: gamma carbonic anhydrase family protein [Opitutus sp.]|nr:gamma carbonic anhydrase family protein [Opitutus sp.]